MGAALQIEQFNLATAVGAFLLLLMLEKMTPVTSDSHVLPEVLLLDQHLGFSAQQYCDERAFLVEPAARRAELRLLRPAREHRGPAIEIGVEVHPVRFRCPLPAKVEDRLRR
jgi:hypothetical protein